MAHQIDCGDLIIDAVLTDIGRKKLIRGDLEIVSFGLGDDEIDYSTYNRTSCTDDFTKITDTPTLEAYGNGPVNIQYGLLSMPRDDFLYVPKIHINEIIEPVAKRYKNRYYLAINEETVNKIKQDIGAEYILQNDKSTHKYILVESGMDFPETSGVPRDFKSKESYILNYGLYDKYYYVHCDRRFIDNILISDPNGQYRNTKDNKLINTIQPLVSTKQINIKSYVENYSVFRAPAVDNEVYNKSIKINELIHTVINGPRSSLLALNFDCDQKLVTDASSGPDSRFVRFGTINASPFPTNTKYDFIDTVIMIEGTVTKSDIRIPIRIIRYRSG
tara:strand:- start:3990 stop:4985 length:996 start_codon:yes stop_codon:yes gene_type:complete